MAGDENDGCSDNHGNGVEPAADCVRGLCPVPGLFAGKEAVYRIHPVYHVLWRRHDSYFLVVKQVGLYDSIGALFIPQAVNVFNFIVMRTFFRELPRELEEAARIDGASDIQTLIKIILPLSLPIIATIGLFYAVGYWNGYFDALLYIQNPDKYTLQLRLRSLLFGDELNNSANLEGVGTQVMTQSLKMATVAVSTIPILIVYPWLQKYFVKGVMVGSVKG